MVARRRVKLFVKEEVKDDFQSMDDYAIRSALKAIKEMIKHPMAGDIKDGRLSGARSWDFEAFEGDTDLEGRIIYVIKEANVIVFTIHSDHDDAYRRARKRAAKFL